MERTKHWLANAAAGTLQIDGERFELPEYCDPESPAVCFSEDQASYERWISLEDSYGIADLSKFEDGGLRFITRIYDRNGTVLYEPSWGFAIRDAGKEPERAIWIRLTGIPFLEPWAAPRTWAELGGVFDKYGTDLWGVLKTLAPELRDRKRHYALIVFPVPVRIGEKPSQMHVQPILLPPLTTHSDPPDGFRPGEHGAWFKDRNGALRNSAAIPWRASENGAYSQTAVRGRWDHSLASKKLLVFGYGAIGSVLADMLVRGGVRNLMVGDGETLRVGNLVRHDADLRLAGKSKARAAHVELNHASPHAEIEALEVDFPATGPEMVEKCRSAGIIIDCTGSDTAALALSTFDWGGQKTFLSLSTGFEARRLFCYACRGQAFDIDHFRTCLAPWLAQERPLFQDGAGPWEGVGCWHPLFPARIDDVTALVAVSLRWIERVARGDRHLPELLVYEQVREGSDRDLIRVVERPSDGT